MPYRKIYSASDSSSQTCGLYNQHNAQHSHPMHRQYQVLQLEANLIFSANDPAVQGSASKRVPGTAQGQPHRPAAEGFLAFISSCQQPRHSCFTAQVRFPKQQLRAIVTFVSLKTSILFFQPGLPCDGCRLPWQGTQPISCSAPAHAREAQGSYSCLLHLCMSFGNHRGFWMPSHPGAQPPCLGHQPAAAPAPATHCPAAFIKTKRTAGNPYTREPLGEYYIFNYFFFK